MATIEEHGLTELIRRMQAYPDKLRAAVELTMEAALLTIWESVPPYPVYPDPLGHGSSYERTGKLGQSLGSGESGGKSGGSPDIYEISAGDGGMYTGRFGSNIEYAEWVIGDDTQSARMGYWWQMKDVVRNATDKIHRIFQGLGAQMASFLEGRGG